MKRRCWIGRLFFLGRTPRGVRGLKRLLPAPCGYLKKSHPARGAWIETAGYIGRQGFAVSHPARGAWIETLAAAPSSVRTIVAPREGCVD